MQGLRFAFLSLILLLGTALVPAAEAPVTASEIVAYVFPEETILRPGQIDPHRVTRLNFAFANIKAGRLVSGLPSDDANLAYLVGLRTQNPSLKVLISVGGWGWSSGFSDVAFTESHRRRFVASAVNYLAQHHLDGIDMDWEYPGMPGAGHAYRAADKHNFTVLLKELRDALDEQQNKTGKHLLLTIAAGATEDYLEHTEMAQVQQYVDTVNVMTYDYSEPSSGPLTGHNSPLYSDPSDPVHESADRSIQNFERAGVPSRKLLLGIPFYGHAWSAVGPRQHGLYQHGKPAASDFSTYGDIQSKMLHHGFTRYWDAEAAVPFLYDPAKRIFVSYEDAQSVAAKCRYARAQHLGGVMVWSYLGDPSGDLLHTVDTSLHAASKDSDHSR